MKKILSFILTVLMLSSLIISAFAKVETFADVKSTDWFYDVVTEAASIGVMQGVGNGNFAPKKSITRAEMVTALARIAGADVTGMRKHLKFTDTKTTDWYADYVGWAVAGGLVDGYKDNTFCPGKPILRQELAKLFVCFIDYMKIDIPENPKCGAFTDKLPTWAADYIERLRLSGLVEGSAGRFNPTGNTTRAEFAAIVTRFYPYTRDIMFTKFDNINDYFKVVAKSICLDVGTGEWMTEENLSKTLLTPMGLDTKTYRVVFNSEEIENFVSGQYSNINIGDNVTTSFTVSITNTVTGESTKSKNIRFNLTKTDILIYVDPDDFDSGLDEDVYADLIDKSLVSLGDLSRMAKVFDKAEKGEDITVAYIGGSVTEGTGAGIYSCYARISANWFMNRYPDITVNYVNAGVGGTTSDAGNVRVSHDVLAKNPDLVYIEFSINDSPNDYFAETYESLVRTVLNSDGSPAVVLLFTPDTSGKGAQDNDLAIGQHYNLPMVSVSDAIHYGHDKGYFEWDTYTADGVHPTPWGHQVYSDMVENLLWKAQSAVKEMTPDEKVVKPVTEETVTPARYEGLVYVNGDNARISDLGDWEADEDGFTYKGGTNKPLTMTFTGENIFVIFENGDNNASVVISVDGTEKATVHGRSGAYFSSSFIGKFEDGEHTVSLKVIGGDENKRGRIIAFGIN